MSHAGVPQCSCKSGFTGSHCQNCAALSCFNGGTCVRGGDGKEKCLCNAGYYGKNCEHHRLGCNSCSNGGTCLVGANEEESCVCPPLFTGKKCEVDLCASNNPAYGCKGRCTCSNGGVCELVGQKEVCSCRDVWGGEHCEVSKKKLEFNCSCTILFFEIIFRVFVFLLQHFFVLLTRPAKLKAELKNYNKLKNFNF